jgi:hypothetical protein
LRELWHDEPDEPKKKPEEKHAENSTPSELRVADTFKDPRAPAVMQPTIEVRQPDQEVAPSAGPTPTALAEVPLESGVIIPSPPKDAEPQSPTQEVAPAEEQPGDPQADSRLVVEPVPEGISLDSEKSTAKASGSPIRLLFSRRWQMVALAVALGTAAGIALGFSKGHSSSATKNPIAPAESSIEARSIPRAEPPLVTPESPVAPAVPASASNAESALASAQGSPATSPMAPTKGESSSSVAATSDKSPKPTANKEKITSTAKLPQTKQQPRASDKDLTKKPSTPALRPPYRADDME